MFQDLRSRLLLSYLIVMAAILGLFGIGVYILFGRNLYQELDNKLWTLAQVAAPSLIPVKTGASQSVNLVEKIFGHHLFDETRQSIEWFDAEGNQLASHGTLILSLKPKPGFLTLEGKQGSTPCSVRTFTLFVSIDRSNRSRSSLTGYIRTGQSTGDIERIQRQLLWQIGIVIIIALGFVGLSGLWLTQKALEPVEQSFKRLKQFTADASHELRSPLTAIKASVDVMRKHPDRIHPKDVKKLGAIASAAQEMADLTQDLLFLARMDGTLSTAKSEGTPINLDRLLQDLVDFLEPLAQQKQIELEYQSHSAVTVTGDRSQLKRLFTNLLENALHYTPCEGRISLCLSQQKHLARIDVEDTGIGIAPENLPFVFDRFWRADKARSRREGGTGLGLSIAQAIARLHGGKIEVASQVNVGSRFTVYLPTSVTSTEKSPFVKFFSENSRAFRFSQSSSSQDP